MRENETGPQQIPASEDAYALGQRIALWSIAISALLAVAKISAGVVSQSAALTADGIESASDILASAIVLGGMRTARRPPNERFPYGYGRAESLAGRTVATFLLFSALLLAAHSVVKLFGPRTELPVWTLIPLGISFVVKWGLATAKRRVGRRLRSSALMADAVNDGVDMASATVASLAIGLTLVSPERFGWADPVGGVGVAVIIFIMAARVYRETSHELMDVMPEQQLVQEVRQSAQGVEGVCAVEKCYGRKSGIQFFFDLHVQVDPEMTVLEAHRLAHRVKDTILEERSYVRNVLVHIEPHGGEEE